MAKAQIPLFWAKTSSWLSHTCTRSGVMYINANFPSLASTCQTNYPMLTENVGRRAFKIPAHTSGFTCDVDSWQAWIPVTMCDDLRITKGGVSCMMHGYLLRPAQALDLPSMKSMATPQSNAQNTQFVCAGLRCSRCLGLKANHRFSRHERGNLIAYRFAWTNWSLSTLEIAT